MFENHYHVTVVWRSLPSSVPDEIILDKDYFSSYCSPITVMRSWSEFFFCKELEYAKKRGKLFLSVTDVENGDKVVYSMNTGKVF